VETNSDSGPMTVTQQVEAVSAGQAWADKYGNFTLIKSVDERLTVTFGNGDVHVGDKDDITKLITGECDLCGDTGWIVSYGPGAAGKYPCSCDKGTEKAKKTDYMGPVTTIDGYKKQKAFLASVQQQNNDYKKSQEVQLTPFTPSSLQVEQQMKAFNQCGAEGKSGVGGFGLASNLTKPVPAPAPPEPLPPAVGRKFR